jgi:hypothetical protein
VEDEIDIVARQNETTAKEVMKMHHTSKLPTTIINLRALIKQGENKKTVRFQIMNGNSYQQLFGHNNQTTNRNVSFIRRAEEL